MSDSSNGFSRRALFRGAGVAAAGAVLQSSIAQAVEQIGPSTIAATPGPITLRVNGESVTVHAEPATTLVDVLRAHLGLTGTKIGCDRGACSACTVWLDGKPVTSCMTLVLDARGKEITTIEGLARGDQLHPVQQAFIEHDALQCGFCTPGMVMSCAALVRDNAKCTLDDVKRATSGHLCRCGTYPNVFKATLAAASKPQKKVAGAREHHG